MHEMNFIRRGLWAVRTVRRTHSSVALALALGFATIAPVTADAPAPSTPTSTNASSSVQTPSADNGGAQAVVGNAQPASASGTPAASPDNSSELGEEPAPPVPMTLDQVVERALSQNSAVLLARQELKRAQDQIREAYAEAMPQVTATVVNTLSSGITTQAGGGSGSSGISLPGGGAIPVVVDQGGGSTSTYVADMAGTSVSGATSEAGTVSLGGVIAGGAPDEASVNSQAVSPAPMLLSAAPIVSPQNIASDRQARQPALMPLQTGTTPSSVFEFGSDNNYAARFSVNQAVDMFGLVRASLDVLQRTRDFYTIELDRVSNELALTTKNDFFTVLRDQANVATDQEQVASADENVRITKAKLDQGTVAQYDLLTAQTTLANDQQTLLAAQNQLSVDQAALNSLLGYSLDQPVGITAPDLPPLDTPIDLNAAVQRAYTNRPELRQADNDVAIAKRLVKLNGAGQLPALTISASADYNGPIYAGIPSDDYAVTANLSVPLYDGGAARAQVKMAQSEFETEELTRDQLRQNVTLEVRQAYLSILSARASVSSAQLSAGTAEEAARLADVRFRYGQGTYLDVINAQAQLATARTDLATAQYNLQTDDAQLLRAEGGR